MRTEAAIALLALAACAPPGGTATVVLALEGVPDNVATLSVSVRDLETLEVVASATTTAPKTTFALGVPAEVPLEFRVIARTNRPGPAAVGAMPAYYGVTERTIALDREQERVSLTVHRAGVLTAALELGEGVLADEEETIGVRIAAELAGVRPAEIVFAPLHPDNPRRQRTLVLRAGRYDAEIFRHEDGPEREPAIAGRGLYVARELESVARLRVERAPPAPGPRDPASLSLQLRAGGEPIGEDGAITEGAVALDVRALDAAGGEVDTLAALRVAIAAHPIGLVREAPDAPDPEAEVELPIQITGLELAGTGRLRARVIASLRDGRTLEDEVAVNVLAPGVVPSTAEALVIELDDPDQLHTGTRFALDTVDAQGLYAPTSGFIDLSTSDPWVFFPDGPGSPVTPADRGHLHPRVARPSGPRGLPVVIRAVLTSTVTPGTLTSSVVLPLLEIVP